MIGEPNTEGKMSASQIKSGSVAIVPKQQSFSRRARLAVICDLVEENWPSMDLVADMLLAHFRGGPPTGIDIERIRPPMWRRFTREGSSSSKFAFSADRAFNRFWDYPRFLR